MRHAAKLGAFLAVAAAVSCTPNDFDGYVGNPVSCDPVLEPPRPRDYLACAEGETCYFVDSSGNASTDETRCSAISAKQSKAGDDCTYLSDCSAGQFCTGFGCLVTCFMGSSCADGSPCQPFTPPMTAGQKPVGFCAPAACDPAVAGVCGGSTCSFYQLDRTACLPHQGTAGRGASCMADDDCGRGFACSSSTPRCTTYCRLGQSDCSAGSSCDADPMEALTFGGVSYGYCSL